MYKFRRRGVESHLFLFEITTPITFTYKMRRNKLTLTFPWKRTTQQSKLSPWARPFSENNNITFISL